MDAKKVLKNLEQDLEKTRARGSHADAGLSNSYEAGYAAGEKSGLGTAIIFVHDYQKKINTPDKDHPVWEILDRDLYTSQGIVEIERIHNFLVDLLKKIGLKDMSRILDCIDSNLSETLRILAHYTAR